MGACLFNYQEEDNQATSLQEDSSSQEEEEVAFPSTESSESPKSSTPAPVPKPTPPPLPNPTPAPSLPKPKPLPKLMPQSPKKAIHLHENIQRLKKIATQRLAWQGGLTQQPNLMTQQPSAPCHLKWQSKTGGASADSCFNSQTTAESYAGRQQANAIHTIWETQLPR